MIPVSPSGCDRETRERAPAPPSHVTDMLRRQAGARPSAMAVIVQHPRRSDRTAAACTFARLYARVLCCARGLRSAGFEPGERVLLMVKPGLEFVTLTFALFRIGAVPVMIDPGMGLSRMLSCIRNVAPDSFIGIPAAHVLRVLMRRPFASLRHVVTVGRRWCWGGSSYDELMRKGRESTPDPAVGDVDSALDIPEPDGDALGAILFTSGSTGPPKGVEYRQRQFVAQVEHLRNMYDIRPGEVDLSTFPLFALFAPAMGMTSVVPSMDFTRPAHVNPITILTAIATHRVTNLFGSPALWNRMAMHCTPRCITLPTVQRILIAGAPVSWRILEGTRRLLHDAADVHTPYGATEALPVATISGTELLAGCIEKSRRGEGTCVGRPVPGIEARIITIRDDPVPLWSDDLTVPPGTIGEIVVRGDVVTHAYHGLPQATAAARIRDGDTFWHRMGDLGYQDEHGRLWFCGRKSHRLRTPHGEMYTIPCEAVFNNHPQVHRSALVGVGTHERQEPVIIIEPQPQAWPAARHARLRTELLEMAVAHPLTRHVRHVLFLRSLPVDIRHNAKINREALAVWAARRLTRSSSF